MAFDTTRLIAQINQVGCLPDGRFTDAEILDISYDTMLSQVLPEMLKVREEYFGKSYDTAIAVGVSNIPITTRAVSGVLRELKYIDGVVIRNIDRIEIEKVWTSAAGEPAFYYIEGNDIVLFPVPSASTGTIRQYYFIRPSKFVAVSECAMITAIDVPNKTVTITIPTGWTTTNRFDLVRGRPHYDILAIDLVAGTVGGGTIIFSAALPDSLIVGDYVTLAGESCFPYLPQEGHAYLAQASAAACLESIGDPSAAGVAAKAMLLKKNFTDILSVRVQGAPKRLGTRLL